MDTTYWDRVPTENSVARKIELVRLNGQLMVAGTRREILMFGGAGTGKSFTIYRVLDQFRARGLEPVYANPTGFAQVLETFEIAMMAGKPSRARPIFFDEADSIFASEKCCNIMKVALAPDRSRRIYDGRLLDAPICIASNRLPESFPDGKLPHIEALFDRVPPIIIPRDAFASWQYACYLAITTAMNRRTNLGRSVSLDVQVRALEWFTEHANRLKVVGPRALHRACEIMTVGHPIWAEREELAGMLTSRHHRMDEEPIDWPWRDLLLRYNAR